MCVERMQNVESRETCHLSIHRFLRMGEKRNAAFFKWPFSRRQISLKGIFYWRFFMRKTMKILGLSLAIASMATMASGCQYLPEVEAYLSKFGQLFSSTEDTETFTYDVEKEEGMVAIKVGSVENGARLSALMEDARGKGLLRFESSGGMITSLEGVANPADWSACWMLYTTDEEMSNNAWGTFTYEGKTLGSAILGMESLVVASGETYVWVYQSF